MATKLELESSLRERDLHIRELKESLAAVEAKASGLESDLSTTGADRDEHAAKITELTALVETKDAVNTELNKRLDATIVDYNELVDRKDDEEQDREPVAMEDCDCKLCLAAKENAKLINSGRMSADELLAHGV